MSSCTTQVRHATCWDVLRLAFPHEEEELAQVLVQLRPLHAGYRSLLHQYKTLRCAPHTTAVELLITSFRWHCTPQGHGYWRTVSERPAARLTARQADDKLKKEKTHG